MFANFLKYIYFRKLITWEWKGNFKWAIFYLCLILNSIITTNTSHEKYLYKPWAFDTILIYLYMCVILVSVNITE